MGKAKPEPPSGEIVDLSNNSAWQARLDEARARRAVALEKAGRSEEQSKPRKKPWEDAAPTAVEGTTRERVDFHDRMTRFKALSKVAPAPEKSPEELAEIDRKVFGDKAKAPVSRTFDDDDQTSEPLNIFAPVAEENEALPTLVLTAPTIEEATDVITTDTRAETPVSVEERDDTRPTSWSRTLFRSVCVMVAAVAFFVSANSIFLPTLFWDSTPPTLQTGLNALPPVSPGPTAVGLEAPELFSDTALSASALAPGLIQPATRTELRSIRPLPRPEDRL